MKRYLILGNSPVCPYLIEGIRQHDKDGEITIFSFEEYLPYQRHLFGDFLARNVTEDEVFCKPQEFYGRHGVNMITDKKLIRIDFKKKRLVCENREYVSYDILFLTDVPSRVADIKGANKEGVLFFRHLKDVRRALGILPLTETVVIQANGLMALKLAYGFHKRDKEVIVVLKDNHFLRHIIDKSAMNFLRQSLEKKGIRFIEKNTVTQILGETDVKAVRLQSGKVLAAQIVVIDEDKKNFRFFKDTPLEMRDGIVVNDFYRTHIEDVYALDGLCGKGTEEETADTYELSIFKVEHQAKRALRDVFKIPEEKEEPPFREIPVPLFELEIFLIGETHTLLPEGIFVLSTQNPERFLSFHYRGDILCGAILINMGKYKEKIKEAIMHKESIKGHEETLLDKEIMAFREGPVVL